jgi:DNA-binding transcriptional LysR family regulator
MEHEAAPPPLDLRKLRFFVAVAEELHFGRAADRLYITQPVLSRQIQQLERDLGAELLTRSSRAVRLTSAGEQLLEDARALLATADATRRRIRAAACGHDTLTIGFFIGDVFTETLRAFTRRHPNVDVNLHRIYWNDQIDVLHHGRVDVAFVHLPVDDTGLRLLPVRAEARVAVVARTHPLATRTSVAIAELADDPVIVQRGASETWQRFHNVDPRPDGRRPRPGPAVDNLEEKLQQVATGRAISFLPASAAAAYSQSDVSYIPVTDIPPIPVCIACVARRTAPTIKGFMDAVLECASKERRPPPVAAAP